jgi:solute carrier family 45 protein 1/2/4
LVYNTYTLLLSSKLRNDSLPTLCIAENDPRRTRIANAYFSLFMALGNILGYATGAYSGWYRVFPFTVTPSCGVSCANLKSAFLLDIIILVITTYITVASVQEPQSFGGDEAEHPGAEQEAFLWELFGSFRYFTLPVWMVLIVTALTWIGWFPFILFDTDWMGREIYRGSPDNPEQTQSYHDGVRMGSFGLMLNSVLLGFTSVVLEKLCRKWGAGLVWGVSNILMALCFVAMLVITYVAKNMDYPPSGAPPTGIVIASLVVFTILGAPLAVSNRIVFFHQNDIFVYFQLTCMLSMWYIQFISLFADHIQYTICNGC